MTREDIIEAYMINDKHVIAEMLYDTITKYEEKLKPKSCEGCKYYVSINKSSTMVCSLSLDCIRKYVPQDRWESK